jgi:hypothetical protein
MTPNGTLISVAIADHRQRAEDRVAEAAALHEARRRQLGEDFEAEPSAPCEISM